MRRWTTTAVVCALGLVGCATAPKPQYNLSRSQEEAASLHVAVQSAQAWQDIRPRLSTKLSITEAEALSLALPVTSTQEQAAARQVMASLGLQFPSTAITRTETFEDNRLTEGVETSTLKKEAVTSQASATDPTLPQNPAYASLLGESGKTVAVDPFIQAQTARNLIHYYGLLNQEIEALALGEGNRAYLVRLQVSVSPNKRRQPYDMTLDIAGFLPTANGKDSEAPILLPLVVTDQVERSLQSQAELTAAQLSLALAGGVNGVGGRLGAGTVRQDIRNAISSQYNSLYSLGQLSRNTLRVRLGAQSYAGVYEMVTRNHLVTFLVIVPKGVAQAKSQSDRTIDIVTRAYLSDARTGAQMKLSTDFDAYRATSAQFDHFYDRYPHFLLNCRWAGPEKTGRRLGLSVTQRDCHGSGEISQAITYVRHEFAPSSQERYFDDLRLAHLMEIAQRGDYEAFRNSLQNDIDENSFDEGSKYKAYWEGHGKKGIDLSKAGFEEDAKTLYLELQRFRSSPRVGGTIPLPRMQPAHLPIDQTPILVSDDKAAKVRLYGGYLVQPQALRSVLDLKPKADGSLPGFQLAAVATDSDGKNLDLTFPSLDVLGNQFKASQYVGEIELTSFDAELESTASASAASDPTGVSKSYRVVFQQQKSSTPDVGALTTGSDMLAPKDGVGAVPVQVVVSNPGGAILTASNATLTDVTGVDGVARRGLGFFIPKTTDPKKPPVLVISLSNLVAGKDVTLTLDSPQEAPGYGPKTKTLTVPKPGS